MRSWIATAAARLLAVVLGGPLLGNGLSTGRPYEIVGGAVALGLGLMRPPGEKGHHPPLAKAEEISLEKEREAGLVFDLVGSPQYADPERDCVFKLWPGYWDWQDFVDSGMTSGDLYLAKPFWRVRPEGCVDNYWMDPQEHDAIEALEYFHDEVPKLIASAKREAALKEKRRQEAQWERRTNEAIAAAHKAKQKDSLFCFGCGCGVWLAYGATYSCTNCGLLAGSEQAQEIARYAGAATPLPAAAQSAAAERYQREIACLEVELEGRLGRELTEKEKENIVRAFSGTLGGQLSEMQKNAQLLWEKLGSSLESTMKAMQSAKNMRSCACPKSPTGDHLYSGGNACCKYCGLRPGI